VGTQIIGDPFSRANSDTEQPDDDWLPGRLQQNKVAVVVEEGPLSSSCMLPTQSSLIKTRIRLLRRQRLESSVASYSFTWQEKLPSSRVTVAPVRRKYSVRTPRPHSDLLNHASPAEEMGM
jgi:hypothetical protein